MFCAFVVSAGLIDLAGCRHIEPSPIVTAFHNAGGGDVDHAPFRYSISGISC